MRFSLSLILLPLVLFSCNNTVSQSKSEAEPANEKATFYLIRHAEKQTGEDPSLTAKGEQRAQYWADYFADKDIDAVYSTNTTRTMQTATPTAEKLGLEINQYDPASLYDEAFIKATEGKTILVVGHTNTTANLANKMLGENQFQEIDDAQFGKVFKITISAGDADVEVKTLNSWSKE